MIVRSRVHVRSVFSKRFVERYNRDPPLEEVIVRPRQSMTCLGNAEGLRHCSSSPDTVHIRFPPFISIFNCSLYEGLYYTFDAPPNE